MFYYLRLEIENGIQRENVDELIILLIVAVFYEEIKQYPQNIPTHRDKVSEMVDTDIAFGASHSICYVYHCLTCW